MPDISKVQLPSGGIYNIKDSTAREMISAGVKFVVAWDGTGTPDVTKIPAGVVVHYSGGTATGSMAANNAEPGAFYLVKSSTSTSEGPLDVYDEYVPVGEVGSKTWEKIGDTQVDLSNVVTNVVMNKQTDMVLGESTTFALSSGSVTFGTPSTDTFVKSVSAETNKNLVTTTVPNVTGNTSVTIPNVTSAGSASTWTFTMGSGDDSETLIISGANSVAPTLGNSLTATNTTLGTAITVATGSTSTTGTGDAVVTGVTIGSSASAVTALPTASVGTGITVGTNDKVNVLKNNTALDVTWGGGAAVNAGSNKF